MASTYSTSLTLTEIGTGDQSGTWGTTTNTNLQLIEDAIAGVATINSYTGGTAYTLTQVNGSTDVQRKMTLIFAGTPSGAVTVTAPLVPKFYIIANTTSYQITMTATGGSISLVIPSGVTAQCYCDGTNGFYSAQTGSAGNFTINGALTVTGTSNIIPSGIIQMWATSSAPSGFLLCNGAAVSRSTYSNLFGVLGTTFGSGDGSTTFNIPNYVNRMPIGAGSSYALASTGGATSVTLATANLPSHTHNFSASVSASGSGSTNAATTGVYDAGHAHSYTQFNAHSGSGAPDGYSPSFNAFGSTTGTGNANIQDPGHAHSFSVSTSGTASGTTDGGTGSDTAFSILNPYLGIYFIIKT